MTRPTSRIPVGSGFTPALYDLKSFTQVLLQHSGDREALIRAIWEPSLRKKSPKSKPTRRTANLPLEAAIQYGLLDKAYQATELCERLSRMDLPQLYDEFARHILLNLGGLRIIEGIEQMQADGEIVTADKLATKLSEDGFFISSHNTSINSLRMWLAEAGLFPKKRSKVWKINPTIRDNLVGFDKDIIATLVGLGEDQRQFLRALCAHGPGQSIPASEIRDLAHARTGLKMKRASLPKEYLEPLRRMGLIEYTTGGTAGGKTSIIHTTQEFETNVLKPLLDNTIKDLDPAITAYYLKSIDTIYAELESEDTYIKGSALEAFAIHIMRLLGLRFVEWRKRATEGTGKAEVDVILTGLMGGVATRWQVQCKNTPSRSLTLEDIAKEVGISIITKATHLLFVANCNVTRDAEIFAREVMRHSSLSIVILDKEDFDMIRSSTSKIGEVILARSRAIVALPRHGMKWSDNAGF